MYNLQSETLKASSRLLYNVVYLKEIGRAFDLFGISELEKLWFGEPIFILDDNYLWIEKNFTSGKLLNTAADE